MPYINPIPSPDDKSVSTHYWFGFEFPDYVSEDEAFDSIKKYLSEYPLTKSQIHMDYPHYMRMTEKQPEKEYFVLSIRTENEWSVHHALFYSYEEAKAKGDKLFTADNNILGYSIDKIVDTDRQIL